MTLNQNRTNVRRTTCPWCHLELWTNRPSPSKRRRTYLTHVVRSHAGDIPDPHERARLADVMLREERPFRLVESRDEE